LNFVDAVIGVLLVFAFLKGFRVGVLGTVFGLVASFLAFVGAFYLTGPVVKYLEQSYGVLTVLSDKMREVFVFLPVYGKPYDPGSFGDFMAGLEATPWLEPFKGIIRDHVAAAYESAGVTATWDKVLGFLFSQILVSGVMFMVLLVVLRVVLHVFAAGFLRIEPSSTLERLLGGLLETGVSLIWLSILAGTFYPLMGMKFLAGLREAVSSSTLMGLLLGVHKGIWGFVLSKIGASGRS